MIRHIKRLDWGGWLKGLVAALVTGASGAVTAGGAAAYISSGEFALGTRKNLELMAASAVMSAILGAATYLKQSPIPPEIDVEIEVDTGDRTEAARAASKETTP